MGETPEREPRAAGTPRWVKVFALIALLVVVAVVVLAFTGRGGPHGPRRHVSPADTTRADDAGRHAGLRA